MPLYIGKMLQNNSRLAVIQVHGTNYQSIEQFGNIAKTQMQKSWAMTLHEEKNESYSDKL